MNPAYQLSCESTVDLPYAYVTGRGLSVLFYSYTVDGEEYPDDMGRDPEALPRFYRSLKEGKRPVTSQINTYRYEEYFRELLKAGDVLHIAFGSGMTPSVCNAREAAARLSKEFPDRRLVVCDSLCSCAGYGLLMDQAADRWEAGASLDEVQAWAEETGPQIHHQFFSTDLTMFKRSGRVSGPAAAIATVLGLCPLMRLNAEGRIVAYDKVRGRKIAIREMVREVERHARGGAAYDGPLYLAHSDCPAEAEETRQAIEAVFPQLTGRVRVLDIGTIIASHCGPGTVALFFMGDRRPQ